MKKFFAILLTVFAIASPTPMIAQDYPEYEGVYIWDGAIKNWVEVPPQKVLRVQIASSTNSPQDSWNRFDRFNGWYQIRGYEVDLFRTGPFIDDSGGLRILIKSRDPQLVFVNALTEKNMLASTIPPGPMVDSASISPDIGGTISDNPETQRAAFVETGFGKSPDMFKAKIVDPYTTEYIGLPIPGNWTSAGLGDCNSCDLPILALAVQTKTSFHLFTTVALKNAAMEGEGD